MKQYEVKLWKNVATFAEPETVIETVVADAFHANPNGDLVFGRELKQQEPSPFGPQTTFENVQAYSKGQWIGVREIGVVAPAAEIAA